MKHQYQEEIQAQALYRSLVEQFAQTTPKTVVTISGDGVHWSCQARRANRICSVSCFSSEYCISFIGAPEREPCGRTEQASLVGASVEAWLDGQSVSELYQSFAFIDQHNRFLEQFWHTAVQHHPELQHVTISLEHLSSDFYALWFRGKQRACKLFFYGKEPFPRCEFSWDDTLLFERHADDTLPMFLLIKRWVYDEALPSRLVQEYDGLDVGPLAPYYEAGNGIEGEFILSWDDIVEFYQGLRRFPQTDAVLAMIAQMREMGFDRTLRAGQSMTRCILSRSRRHGLRRHQPHIRFDFSEDGMDVIARVPDERTMRFPTIQYTPEIGTLLTALEVLDVNE
jgi:hypothetical protein